MSIHTLIIRGFHPPRINSVRGRHWSKGHAERKACTQIIAAEAFNQNVPRATGQRRVELHLSGWGGGGRFPDKDAFDKLLLDSLVQARLLTDDNAAGLLGRVTVTYTRSRIKETRIVLEDVN